MSEPDRPNYNPPPRDLTRWHGFSQPAGELWSGVLERSLSGRKADRETVPCGHLHKYAYMASVCAKMLACERNERDDQMKDQDREAS